MSSPAPSSRPSPVPARSRASGRPGRAEEFGRNKLDGLTDRAKKLGAKGLVWMKVAADGSLDSPGGEVPLAGRVGGAVGERLEAEPGDLLLIVADEWHTTCEVLGAAAQRPGPPAGARGPAPLRVGGGVPAVRRRRPRDGQPKPGPPPVLHAAPRRPRPVRQRPAVGAGAGLRPGAERLGAGFGLHPDPRARPAAPGVQCARDHRRGGRAQVRVLPQPVPPTARRPTVASPSASTAWWPSWPARRTSARSSPSPRPSPAVPTP
jgi:hypothetical protein